MPKLSEEEISDFLKEKNMICRIGTVDESGAPLVTPIWFVFEDEKIWFTPRQHSEWLQHIRANSKVGLSIDETDLPCRKVVVRGSAKIEFEVGLDDKWRELYRRICRRYVDNSDDYVDGTIDQPRALCSVYIPDSEVRTWRFPVGSEHYSGIWAKKYWTKDAKIKSSSQDLFEKLDKRV
ncbi:MAG: pyridoxamine 5'-phosphate oxidase family protein [Pseudomonadota bacterium]|nr:pyridoxamine 5'-phosphate oxidase family protein [Pseudomonadota bacterium]